MKRFLIMIILLAAAGYGVKHYLDGKGATPPAAPATRVTTAAVTRADVPLNVELVGNVIAYETVAVKARLDSQVIDVLFKDGDNVKQGQPLFKLDDRAVNAQLKQLEANVAKEKAQMENTRLQYDRAQKLIVAKAVSQAFLDDARATFEAQRAVVTAAQAGLDNTRVLLTYTTITAPIGGRAGTINVTRGNNVKANDTQALVTINQVQPIRVQFAIPERYYEEVKTHMAAGVLAVGAQRQGGQAAQGSLEYIDNAIDPNTGTFAARAIFANENETLWPGMFVTINVTLGTQKNVMTIPAVAVQGDQDNHFVFVADTASKKAVKTPVTLIRIAGETALIEKGLAEGQQVIVDGLLRVSDGASIETGSAAP